MHNYLSILSIVFGKSFTTNDYCIIIFIWLQYLSVVLKKSICIENTTKNLYVFLKNRALIIRQSIVFRYFHLVEILYSKYTLFHDSENIQNLEQAPAPHFERFVQNCFVSCARSERPSAQHQRDQNNREIHRYFAIDILIDSILFNKYFPQKQDLFTRLHDGKKCDIFSRLSEFIYQRV